MEPFRTLLDGRLFDRVCKALLVAEYGADFVVVNDAGGDGGLDGYDPKTGTLFSAYCGQGS